MKKGFTLIELLAVIVILAVIALIATPIVLSIIEETKESAVLRSAEHYLSSLELSIAKKNLTAGGSFSPTECEIQSDGNLLCDGKDTLEVELSGEVPKSGTITFNKGKITDATLTLSNKTIVKNSEGKLVFEETPAFEKGKFSSVCKPVEGTKYNLAAGTEYKCKVKEVMEEKYSDGYTFYVLNTRNKAGEIITESSTDKEAVSINLIMAQNINSDGTPTTKAILESAKDDNGGIYNLVAYNEAGDAEEGGPVTAMTYLNNATSTWENIDNLNITYNDEGEHFTNFKITGKARMPYKNEVSDFNNNNGYLFENLNGGWDYDESTKPTNNISGIVDIGLFPLVIAILSSRGLCTLAAM